MTRWIVASLFGALLAGCGGGAPAVDTPEAAITATPEAFWPAASAERIAPAADALAALEAEITKPKYGNVDRVLIIHRGEVITDIERDVDYEAIVADEDIRSHPFNYQDPAWHPFYNGTDLHTLQSITKSVTSMTVGVAVTRGDFGDVRTTKAIDFLDGAVDLPHRDAWLEAMTVHDLLAMRSGMASDRMGTGENANETTFLLEESDDWVQFALNDPMSSEPGTEWEYVNGATQVLGMILQSKVGMTVEDYAAEHLFAPLGVEDHYWKKTNAGRTDALGGLYLEAEDLAKMCKLMTDGGIWNGDRILSEEWIETSTRAYSTLDENVRGSGYPGYKYGYQWWIPSTFSETSFEGRGYGGQKLLCSPDDDLIVVLYRWNPRDVAVFKGAEDPYPLIRDTLRAEILPLLK